MRPRRFALRVALTAVMLAAMAVAAGLLGDLTGWPAVSAWAVCAPFTAWLAPQVSYRRRDALLGPWAFLVVAWRVTLLPFRDWPPRDDEVPAARYVAAADFPGTWDPEYAGLWRITGRAG